MQINYKRTTYILAAVLALTLLGTFSVLAGSITSGAAPGATNSYTLSDIYNRLNAGTTGSQSTFTEPAAGPGSTMYDLNTVMAVAPAVDDTDGAGVAHVASGQTFWGLTSGEWGLKTGTASSGSTYNAGVPKTGQTTSYATSDDGDLERGVAWPNPRFTDNSDGTVTDNLTGLIWLTNANCYSERSWANALSDAAALAHGTCGLTDSSSAGDWRLPSVREMQSLAHYGFANPAVPNTAGTSQWSAGDPFTGLQSSYYWSGTTNAGNTTSTWYVNLSGGYAFYNYKWLSYYVWPVRAGQ